MAVVIETTIGDITVDLFTDERPQTCKNFLKLCKIKYYNFCLFHSIQANFIAQTGDPTGVGTGGESVFGVVYGNDSRFYEGEKMPKIKHNKPGLLSMVNCGNNMLGSQFFVTLGTDLQSLEEHCVFAEVTEGLEILVKLNDAICDHQHRPYQDIRITHTVILDDPFEDLPGLLVPPLSPDLSQIKASNGRIGADEKINEEEGLSEAQLHEIKADREAKARATILEIVGDLPDAEIAPPENVLFVCKLNPVTTDEDLEIIFSRFGKVKSCEVIRDHATAESLQYAFVEFEDQRSCEQAYLKMDNVLIDDRRIHVDFSQSVSKIKWKGKGRGVQYFDKVEEKDLSRGNSDRYGGGKREHYRDRDRERDRERNDRRGRDDDRRRRGVDRENEDHQRGGRRNIRRREDRWAVDDDRWEEEKKRRDDRRRDDDRRYNNRRGDDRRRGGLDDDRRRGDDKKRNGTDRRSGLDRDSMRRTNEPTESKEDRLKENKAIPSVFDSKEGSLKRERSKTSHDKSSSHKKIEEKVMNNSTDIKNKEEVKDVANSNNVSVVTQQTVERMETFEENYSNDNNYKESPKEVYTKLTTAEASRRKKKRRRASTSSNSSSSDSESSSSSTSLEKKKRSKSSLTVAKKYYHKGKLVKVVKKKKNKSSDSESLSDESSDSDRRRKKRKYKKIIKVIKKRRRSSDDTDSDTSSTCDSDSSRYKKKKRKSDRNNKKKRKDGLKKNKKKKHYDSSETSETEEEKDKRKNKTNSNLKKHKVEASE